MLAQPPPSLSAHVRAFCRQINPGAEPVYLPITPEWGVQVGCCFPAVRQKVTHEGGRMQCGWVIWEWPRVYLEAEHHAVYEPPTGPPWVDITPSVVPAIHRRLFLPDDRAVYDLDNGGVRRDNRRQAARDDPLIQAFFAAAAAVAAIMNRLPVAGEVTLDAATCERMDAAQAELVRRLDVLAMKYAKPQERCYCGSGKKFKRCHGAPRRAW